MNRYDELPDAILQLDPGGVVVEANAVARRLLGCDPVGQSIAQVCEPRTAAGHPVCERGLPPAARLRSVTRIVDQPLLLRTAAGDLTVHAAGTYVRSDDGHLLGAVVSLRPPPGAPTRQPTPSRSSAPSATSCAAPSRR